MAGRSAPVKVFVSYATADMATVDMVRRWSSDPQVEVFVAEHSAPAGAGLNDAIIDAIKSCDLFLLLWSSDAAKSEYVLQEVGVAVGADRPILPVVLEQEIRLPALIAHLKYLDAPRFPSEWLVAVQQRLSEMVAERRDAEPTTTKAPRPNPGTFENLSTREVVLLAAIVVLVLIILADHGGTGPGAA